MISSIVLTGRHQIGVSSNNKIKVQDNVLSIEKNIPFVRYRFDTYDVEDFQYIKDTKDKFKYSTHLVEIKLSDKSKETLEYIENNIENIAKYIYLDVTDENVKNGCIDENQVSLLMNTLDFTVDRYMLVDKTTMLDTVTAKKLIAQLKSATGLSDNMFGICSSPLSFGEWACLTAVKARELMSEYSTISDVALPSANHQCMNCCGCIRYMVITEDIEAPSDGKQKKQSNKKTSTKEKTKDASTKQKQKVKKKVPLGFGEFRL